MAHIYNSQLDAYTLYHQQQESQHRNPSVGPVLPALGHAIAGSTGTAISNLALYPLDLIITRLQVQKQLLKKESSASSSTAKSYDGIIDAARRIYFTEGGIEAFYSGVLQDTTKSIADSFLFFLFYNFLRTRRLQKHGVKATTLPALDELTVGAMAGAASKFFTTPISNIVTRKQIASMVSSRRGVEPTVKELAQAIRAEKGIQGFWSGYSASLILTLNPSLTFFLYETFKRLLVPRAQRDNPGAKTTFLLAAISKAIASSITYPFSLAKTRAQTESRDEEDSDKTSPSAASAPPTDADSPKEKLEKEAKRKAIAARRRTVFAIILHIYKTEGLAALYEGVEGEIAKGFFSNGITMLVKESIHGLIVRLYFALLRILPTRFSQPSISKDSPTSLTSLARDVEKGSATEAGTHPTVVTAVVNALAVGYANARSFASNASEFVREGNEALADEAANLLEDVDVPGNAEKVAAVGGSVGQGLKEGLSNVADKASGTVDLLGNAVKKD